MEKLLIIVGASIAIWLLAMLLAPLFKGYRTQILNGLSFVGIVAAWAIDFPWQEYLGPEDSMLLVAGANLANMMLRQITTTPVGKA